MRGEAPEGASELGDRATGEQGHSYEHEEEDPDLMDEVMREIYGDDWNAGDDSVEPAVGLRTPRARSEPRRRGRGLGWADADADTDSASRFGMHAEDASFGGPDCTMRLITSPSTPWIA